MERYKKGNDREQLSMLPMSLDDMISPDAEVRALEVIVDKRIYAPLALRTVKQSKPAESRMTL